VKQNVNRPGSYEAVSRTYVEPIPYEVDYIVEKDALRLPPCKDLKLVPSLGNSTIRLRGRYQHDNATSSKKTGL